MSTLPERFAWIFDHRRTNPGALSEAAGLSRSHIGGMLRKIEAGDDPNPTRKTMTRIAKAANVSARWLMLGVEPREPFDPNETEAPASPSPPPVSDTVTTLDATDELINAAFNPERHRPSDLGPVRDALRTGAPLLRSAADPVAHVRHMLDAVARRRERGQRTSTDDLPSATVAQLSDELRAQQAANDRLRALVDEARSWMVKNGIDPDNLPAAKGPSPSQLRHPKPAKKS